jgi:hypothetical protein
MPSAGNLGGDMTNWSKEKIEEGEKAGQENEVVRFRNPKCSRR